MGDFSLNPLIFFFPENCKNSKPVAIRKETPVKKLQTSFLVKFINNTFNNFNNVYYCFLLSGTAIESHPGKQLNKKYFATNQIHCIFKGFLKFRTYFTIFRSVRQAFSAHLVIIIYLLEYSKRT